MTYESLKLQKSKIQEKIIYLRQLIKEKRELLNNKLITGAQ